MFTFEQVLTHCDTYHCGCNFEGWTVFASCYLFIPIFVAMSLSSFLNLNDSTLNCGTWVALTALNSPLSCVCGHVSTFPQCNCSLEFSEVLSQNRVWYHWLSVSGISKIVRCGILINMSYWLEMIIIGEGEIVSTCMYVLCIYSQVGGLDVLCC